MTKSGQQMLRLRERWIWDIITTHTAEISCRASTQHCRILVRTLALNGGLAGGQYWDPRAWAVNYGSIIPFPHTLDCRNTARDNVAPSQRELSHCWEEGKGSAGGGTGCHIPAFPAMPQLEHYSPPKTLLLWEFCLRESSSFVCAFVSLLIALKWWEDRSNRSIDRSLILSIISFLYEFTSGVICTQSESVFLLAKESHGRCNKQNR